MELQDTMPCHLKTLKTFGYDSHKCMHKSCLLEKNVGLSTIYQEMKCFVFGRRLISSCGNSMCN